MTYHPILEISKLGPETAKPGDIVEYSIVIKNIGAFEAMDVGARDVLPDGFSYINGGGTIREWILGDLQINESKTLTFKVKIPDNAEWGTYTNRAEVWAVNHRLVYDVASLKIPEVKAVEALPILSVSKTSNIDFVKPGYYFFYTIRVENTGNAPAINVSLEDNLPTGLVADGGFSRLVWNIPLIERGSFAARTFTVYALSDARAGVYENIAVAFAENHPNKVYGKDIVSVTAKLPHTGSNIFENWPFVLGILSLCLSLAGLIKFPAKRKTFSFSALVISIIVLSHPLWPLIGYYVFPANAASQQNEENYVFQKIDSVVIPKIGVDIPIVEGENDSALERGAWLMPGSPSPDQLENTSFAAHRYKYRPPNKNTFYLLDKLETGDSIVVYWKGVKYKYQVFSSVVVDPSDTSVLEAGTEPMVTLITCTPLFSDKYRLIVKARLAENI